MFCERYFTSKYLILCIVKGVIIIEKVVMGKYDIIIYNNKVFYGLSYVESLISQKLQVKPRLKLELFSGI